MTYDDNGFWKCGNNPKRKYIIQLINKTSLPLATKEAMVEQIDILRFRTARLYSVGDIIMYFQAWGRTKEKSDFWACLEDEYRHVPLPKLLYKTLGEI